MIDDEAPIKSSHQQNTITAGYHVVAQSDVAVAHMTDGPCWDDAVPQYIPFASMDEAVAHGNAICTKCGPEPVVPEPIVPEPDTYSEGDRG